MPYLNVASGTGLFWPHSEKIIRLIRFGCTNRPFYHIVVTERKRNNCQEVIEQVGTFDPMDNEHNEKLVSLNVERIRHWMTVGVSITRPTAELLGLAGFMPIHPRSYMNGWRNRKAKKEELLKQQEELANKEAVADTN